MLFLNLFLLLSKAVILRRVMSILYSHITMIIFKFLLALFLILVLIPIIMFIDFLLFFESLDLCIQNIVDMMMPLHHDLRLNDLHFNDLSFNDLCFNDLLYIKILYSHVFIINCLNIIYTNLFIGFFFSSKVVALCIMVWNLLRKINRNPKSNLPLFAKFKYILLYIWKNFSKILYLVGITILTVLIIRFSFNYLNPCNNKDLNLLYYFNMLLSTYLIIYIPVSYFYKLLIGNNKDLMHMSKYAIFYNITFFNFSIISIIFYINVIYIHPLVAPILCYIYHNIFDVSLNFNIFKFNSALKPLDTALKSLNLKLNNNSKIRIINIRCKNLFGRSPSFSKSNNFFKIKSTLFIEQGTLKSTRLNKIANILVDSGIFKETFLFIKPSYTLSDLSNRNIFKANLNNGNSKFIDFFVLNKSHNNLELNDLLSKYNIINLSYNNTNYYILVKSIVNNKLDLVNGFYNNLIVGIGKEIKSLNINSLKKVSFEMNYNKIILVNKGNNKFIEDNSIFSLNYDKNTKSIYDYNIPGLENSKYGSNFNNIYDNFDFSNFNDIIVNMIPSSSTTPSASTNTVVNLTSQKLIELENQVEGNYNSIRDTWQYQGDLGIFNYFKTGVVSSSENEGSISNYSIQNLFNPNRGNPWLTLEENVSTDWKDIFNRTFFPVSVQRFEIDPSSWDKVIDLFRIYVRDIKTDLSQHTFNQDTPVTQVLNKDLISKLFKIYCYISNPETVLRELTLKEFLLHINSCLAVTYYNIIEIDKLFIDIKSTLMVDYPKDLRISYIKYHFPNKYNVMSEIIERLGTNHIKNYFNSKRSNSMYKVIISLDNYLAFIETVGITYSKETYDFSKLLADTLYSGDITLVYTDIDHNIRGNTNIPEIVAGKMTFDYEERCRELGIVTIR